jgi:hypothetical protein
MFGQKTALRDMGGHPEVGLEHLQPFEAAPQIRHDARVLGILQRHHHGGQVREEHCAILPAFAYRHFVAHAAGRVAGRGDDSKGQIAQADYLAILQHPVHLHAGEAR